MNTTPARRKNKTVAAWLALLTIGMVGLVVVGLRTRATLRRAGIASHSVLTGTFAALASHDLMAGRKIANITHYHALFPEYRLVFIGDSGQGDVTVGELIRDRFGAAVDAVLIHDVVDTPAEVRAGWAAQGIETFDTYVGAASLLHRRGLIGTAALARVIEQTLAGLNEVAWESPEQERRIRDLVARDADALVHDQPGPAAPTAG